jgi:membrane associated rhomboid family serine protease
MTDPGRDMKRFSLSFHMTLIALGVLFLVGGIVLGLVGQSWGWIVAVVGLVVGALALISYRRLKRDGRFTS